MKQFDYLKPLYIQIDANGELSEKLTLENNKVVLEDIEIVLEKYGSKVSVSLTATKSLVSHIYLTYDITYNPNSLIFGDVLERGYGDMLWTRQNNDRQMFWYFFIKENVSKTLDCFGVDVLPNSIVSFFLKEGELVVDINTQSGGIGVNLEGRRVSLATFSNKTYTYENLDDTIKEFLKNLMDEVEIRLPKPPVYGFNNWYYAYGESSYKQIMDDTLLLEELTKDNEVIPYMVIDDGWSINPCGGPWVVNKKFIDMKKLASEMKQHRVRPGIWFRPLKDSSGRYDDFMHPLRPGLILDPTTPECLNLIKQDITNFVNWGYELIKLDFVTVDIFLNYGFEMDKNLTPQGWRYKDNHYTNAEIIKNMYLVIREAAKDAILIGCNAVGHLCAGICELNRTGDDTSGFEWERTRKMGVNSLAYRLYHNDVFYKIDADCVGIMDKIPWEQNKLWLDVLAKSNSPLFVSCDPYKVTDEIKKDLKEAFLINEKQNCKCFPVDIDDNLFPKVWSINGEKVEYNWFIIDK